jgi:two-component system sensor histidine kinase BaeS
MPTRGKRLLGPIGVRLALAMVAVALGAVAVFAGLVLVSAADEVRGLATEVQTAATQTVAETVADAYRARGGWGGVDLTAATAFANEADATLTVLNKRGAPIGPPRVDQNVSNPTGALRSAAVTVSGEPVGRAVLHFATSGLSGPEHQLRVALWENVAVGSGVAAVLALILSVLVSRRITQPVVELTAAVQAMESGDRTARVERPHAPGELEDLGLAFNRFADALARDEGVRRAVVSDVAHELRTPLAILQASTEALIDHVERPTNAVLASLHDEVLRIGRIVQDLETLSSAQAAQLQMKSGPQDLASICRNAMAAMGPFFASAGIAVVQDLRPVEAHVDADRIQQVVVNLLSNAIKFTPPGGTVTIRTFTETDDAVLIVSDTGLGIPPEEIDHIFERFWRGANAGRVGGSGIGLAVVDELVRAHGGRVSVRSEPDRGTHFEVRVLLAPSSLEGSLPETPDRNRAPGF